MKSTSFLIATLLIYQMSWKKGLNSLVTRFGMGEFVDLGERKVPINLSQK